MRKVTSILCSIAFAISGIMMAVTASDPSPGSGYKTLSAATLPYLRLPSADTGTIAYPIIPQDLLLDLAKKKGLNTTEQTSVGVDSATVDSLKQRIVDLEQRRQVTKVKWRRAPALKPIVKSDTIRVPVYYLATQVGNKEGPTGECISVYEVHKVDKICPENLNSSVEDTTEYHIKVDD